MPIFTPPLAPATQAHAVSPSNHLQSYVGAPLVAPGTPSLMQNQFSGLLSALQLLSAQAMQSQPGLVLSPASDPFPRNLVQRVQAGLFVEMRDLLADNIALLSQLLSLHNLTNY